MTTTIEKSVEINAPLRAAYDFWANFAGYPRFMPQLQAVEQMDDTHWRWRGELGGKPVEWDAEITENVPDQSIGWQTRSKGHRSNTTVRFAPLGDGRIAVTFTAHYPNGVGKGLSAADLAQQAEEHLARFTELLLGGARTEAQQENAEVDQSTPDEPAQRAEEDHADAAAGRESFHAASTWPFGQAAARRSWASAVKSDSDPDNEQDDQSTTDVLGPAYTLKPGGPDIGASWRARADAADTSGWLRESGLARSLDALMAANPLLPLQAPRSVMQAHWFATALEMMTWPWTLAQRLTHNLDRQVRSTQALPNDQAASENGAAWAPSINVDQSEDSLTVRADLPGVAYDDDVEVEVRDGQLVISGEVRRPIYADGHEPASDGPSDGQDAVHGRFVRAIPLPEGVDAYGAQARLQDGVLEVTLAGPAQRHRRIEVSHGQRRH